MKNLLYNFRQWLDRGVVRVVVVHRSFYSEEGFFANLIRNMFPETILTTEKTVKSGSRTVHCIKCKNVRDPVALAHAVRKWSFVHDPDYIGVSFC